MAESNNIRVSVRVRPLSLKEIGEGDSNCLTLSDHSTTISAGENSRYKFDNAFPPPADQEELFEGTAKPLVDDVFKGYNVTVMAYGQTGSGKTYTMGTSDTALSQDIKIHGIVPRFMSSIFERAKEFGSRRKFTFTASLLEIYKEELRDLCCNSGPTLRLGEAKNGQVMIQGLSTTTVYNTHDVMKCLQKGLVNRVTGSTNMNNVSSRSHAVLEVVCVNEPADTPAEGEDLEAQSSDEMGTMTTKITFVDLAGSERLKRTGAEGARKKEGISINTGLLHLGSVINALSRGLAHIPYRNSILTRILQNALGGNSRTLFLACVSPATANLEETINTLRYAWRAKMIKNSAVVNMDEHSLRVMLMKRREAILMRELVKERFGGGYNCSDEDLSQLMISERTKDYLNGILEDANSQDITADKSVTVSRARRASSSASTGLTRVRASSASSSSSSSSSSARRRSSGSGSVSALDVKAAAAMPIDADDFDELEEFEKVLQDGNKALGIVTGDAKAEPDRFDSEEFVGEDATECIDTSELVAQTQLEAQSAEISGVKMECEEVMSRQNAKQNAVQQDLQNKQELLKKLLNKTKDYRVRYNQLRMERDEQEKAMQRFELEKKNLVTKIKKAEKKYLQLKRANSSNNNNDTHIEAMKAQVKKLGEKVKDSRREMRAKERQIAVLKGLSNLAKRLQGKIGALKQKKVMLIAERRKTEQKYKQIVKDKTRALNSRNKELQKAKREQVRITTTNQRQKKYLIDRQRKLVNLRTKLRETNAKYLKMVNQRIKRVVGKRKTKSALRVSDDSTLHMKLRDYISRRVVVRAKANELKSKLKMRGEMLREMLDLESHVQDTRQNISSNNNEVEVLQDKININETELDLTNQELEGLMSDCPAEWELLPRLNAAQRATLVQFLIDEFVAAQDDWRKLDDENMYNQKRGDEYKERFRLATEKNQELTTQIQELNKQLAESKRRNEKLQSRMSAGTDCSTPTKRKSSDPEIDSVIKRFKKERMSLLPDSVDNSPQHVISARRSRRSSFGAMTNDKARFRDALKRVRAEQQKERQKLLESENKRELSLKGMHASDMSRAERNKKGNDYLRSNTRKRRQSMSQLMPVNDINN